MEALPLEVMEEERREFSVTRSWISQSHKKQKVFKILLSLMQRFKKFKDLNFKSNPSLSKDWHMLWSKLEPGCEEMYK